MWNHSLQQYNYHLPEERIAKFPLADRSASKLLHFQSGHVVDRAFTDLVKVLPEDALLVFNNTKVIPARLAFNKKTGARIEVFCLEPLQPSEMNLAMGATRECVWKCMIGNSKRFKADDLLEMTLPNGLAVNASRIDNSNNIKFTWSGDIDFSSILDEAGKIPLPPYLNRDAELSDYETYQTVYAEHKGAVAAPTAGLHFTDDVLKELIGKGIGVANVTLHVGAGTFQPVKVDDVREHNMHGEHFVVQKDVLMRLQKHQGPVIPVGTTSLRTLESLYHFGCRASEGRSDWNHDPIRKMEPYEKQNHVSREKALEALVDKLDANKMDTFSHSTEIMVMPGYRFRLTDALITNFHQPGSTLIMLVAALLGKDWKTVYEHALKQEYRFLSYGDSSLLQP